MTTDANNSEATAADAFQLISDEGLKRGGFRHRLAFRLRIPPWAISVAAVLVLLAVAAVSYRWFYPPLQKVPVAVLLPQIPDAGPEGREITSVEQNVRRQLEGFNVAWKENGIASKSLERRLHSYSLPLDDAEAERLMLIIKDLYSDGVRTFIITLSGPALKLGKLFKAWVTSMPDRHRPLLIATVASAPDIADIEHGIFRHYIRSEDESSVFSSYISLSKKDNREVFLIHIDDSYGRQAKKTLRDSGIKLSRVLPIRANDNKKDNYDSLIRSRIHPHAGTEKYSYVIVVGYGAMVKNMVSKLISLNPPLAVGGTPFAFEVDRVPRLEEVLVVSTFTESRWRPSDEVLNTAAEKLLILTLGTDKKVDRREDRGVVFQFSFLTLDKAIKCSRKMHTNRGLKAFAKCWETLPAVGRAKQWMPTVEMLVNGDSHIPLHILDRADW